MGDVRKHKLKGKFVLDVPTHKYRFNGLYIQKIFDENTESGNTLDCLKAICVTNHYTL